MLACKFSHTPYFRSIACQPTTIASSARDHTTSLTHNSLFPHTLIERIIVSLHLFLIFRSTTTKPESFSELPFAHRICLILDYWDQQFPDEVRGWWRPRPGKNVDES